MSVTIDDLVPKTFKVTVQGLELDCKPPRLSQTMMIAKLGTVLQDYATATTEELKQVEKDVDEIISELIPELAGRQIGVDAILELLPQISSNSKPSDNKELENSGVKIDADPKAMNPIVGTIG